MDAGAAPCTILGCGCSILIIAISTLKLHRITLVHLTFTRPGSKSSVDFELLGSCC